MEHERRREDWKKAAEKDKDKWMHMYALRESAQLERLGLCSLTLARWQRTRREHFVLAVDMTTHLTV